jgi:hypothetical protein
MAKILYVSSDLSKRFAVEVAGWNLRELKGENGDVWHLWVGADGVMCDPPKFSESIDSILPFLENVYYEVSAQPNDIYVVMNGVKERGDSLAEAMCRALLLSKNNS